MVVITPATAEGSGVVKFGKKYPNRFFDVAICEQHAVTMAAAMAKTGLKPVVSIYSTFLQRAMDQVIHDVAILKLPVIFGIDRGGLVEDGETHQGVFDVAYLRSVPNFTVLAPKDACELRNMLYTALREANGPVAIRFPRDQALNWQSVTTGSFASLDYRRWEIMGTGDCDSVILAYGSMVDVAMRALELLKAKLANVSSLILPAMPTLINARSAKPLDEELLDRLFDLPVKKIVTLEEACLTGGFGTAVLEWAAAKRITAPANKQPEIACLGVKDLFIEHGARSILLNNQGLDAESVADFIQQFVLNEITQ